MSAANFKSQADAAFSQGQFDNAVTLYSRAIDIDSLSETAAIYFSNRAACYLKLKQSVKALADSEKAIHLRPTWFKGHIRKAFALFDLLKPNACFESLMNAIRLEPNCPDYVPFICNVIRWTNSEDGFHPDMHPLDSTSKVLPFSRTSSFQVISYAMQSTDPKIEDPKLREDCTKMMTTRQDKFSLDFTPSDIQHFESVQMVEALAAVYRDPTSTDETYRAVQTYVMTCLKAENEHMFKKIKACGILREGATALYTSKRSLNPTSDCLHIISVHLKEKEVRELADTTPLIEGTINVCKRFPREPELLYSAFMVVCIIAGFSHDLRIKLHQAGAHHILHSYIQQYKSNPSVFTSRPPSDPSEVMDMMRRAFFGSKGPASAGMADMTAYVALGKLLMTPSLRDSIFPMAGVFGSVNAMSWSITPPEGADPYSIHELEDLWSDCWKKIPNYVYQKRENQEEVFAFVKKEGMTYALQSCVRFRSNTEMMTNICKVMNTVVIYYVPGAIEMTESEKMTWKCVARYKADILDFFEWIHTMLQNMKYYGHVLCAHALELMSSMISKYDYVRNELLSHGLKDVLRNALENDAFITQAPHVIRTMSKLLMTLINMKTSPSSSLLRIIEPSIFLFISAALSHSQKAKESIDRNLIQLILKYSKESESTQESLLDDDSIIYDLLLASKADAAIGYFEDSPFLHIFQNLCFGIESNSRRNIAALTASDRLYDFIGSFFTIINVAMESSAEDGQDSAAAVDHILKLILAAVECLLSNPAEERGRIVTAYSKLTEVLVESSSEPASKLVDIADRISLDTIQSMVKVSIGILKAFYYREDADIHRQVCNFLSLFIGKQRQHLYVKMMNELDLAPTLVDTMKKHVPVPLDIAKPSCILIQALAAFKKSEE